MKERLQKILAHAGVASRRAAEALITSGKVRVNGRVVSELGTLADAHHDRIEVDGKRIVLEKPLYLVLHKPRGVVSTLHDPEGRPSLAELVREVGARVYPIGRLDFHTSGVLLLTNDGELTDALLHPRRDVPKVYVAKVRGLIALERLEHLRNGVTLDDGEKTKPADVFVLREEGANTWLQITLYEGRNRQIHRMGEAVGHPVLRLARLSFAGVTSERLKPGQLRPLTTDELDKLKKNYLTPYRRARGAARSSGAELVEDEAPEERPAREPRPGSPKRAASPERPLRPRRDERAPEPSRAAPREPRRGASSSDASARGTRPRSNRRDRR